MQADAYHYESSRTQTLQWKTLIKVRLPLDLWEFLLTKPAQIEWNTQLSYRHIEK